MTTTACHLEFADAYRAGIAMSRDALSERMNALRERMKRAKARYGKVPAHLVFAYQGYERAEIFREYGVVR